MGVHIYDNKLVIITEPKIISINLTKRFITKRFIIAWSYYRTQLSFSWAYNKNKNSQLLSNYKHQNGIHEHGKQ